MKLKSLNWLYHGKTKKKRLTIFSIDIQPFGKFIVTSGQDSLVKIWVNYFYYSDFSQKNMFFKEDKKINYSKHKKKLPIFTITPHPGSINIVRWATHGLLFASGGDGGYLIIYEKIRNPNKKIMWRIFDVFKKHIGDIVDLVWCPSSSFIGTVSLDNNIYIWCIYKKCVFVKLSSHIVWIKGICWDVSGKFLVTQSENQKIILWDTKKWKIFKILSLKRKRCNQKLNLFNRSCWSTCGNNLIICNLTSKKKSALFIFSRSDEFSNCFLITGQKFLSKALRSSHRLYVKKNSTKIFSLFSIGSTKGKFGIWSYTLSKGLITIKKIQKSQILDISWSTNGYDLLICFLNGHVIQIKFCSQEIGKVISIEEHAKILKKIFFKSNKKKKNKKMVKIIKFSIRKPNLFAILQKTVNNFIESEKEKKNLNFFFTKKNFYLIKSEYNKLLKNFLEFIQINFNGHFAYNDQKGYLNNSIEKFFEISLFSSFKKKKKKFSIFKQKFSKKFQLNFFSCPLFSFQLRSLFFVLLSKKKKILLKTKQEKKDNKFFFCLKISKVLCQENFIKILSCEGSVFIVNVVQLTLVFFHEPNELFPNIFSNHEIIYKFCFFYCSGLLGCSV